jgi:hypothetical protein
LHGRVDSVARGIVVSNATPGNSGLANVNPIFTWVRLAQRVPVRIHFEDVPKDLRLVIGMTATIEIEPKSEGAKLEVQKPEPVKPDVQQPVVPKPEAQKPEAEELKSDGSDKSETSSKSHKSDKNNKSSSHGR